MATWLEFGAEIDPVAGTEVRTDDDVPEAVTACEDRDGHPDFLFVVDPDLLASAASAAGSGSQA